MANVRRDGALTKTALVWHDAATERMVVLSGNHRIMAAHEVGLTAVDIIVVDQKLSRARQVALQLSHNAIEGEDDPATLKHLYEELDAARASFDEARKLVQADARWLAGYGDYEAALDALATTHGAHNVGNVATALGLILQVFERHLGELRDGLWFDPESGEPIGNVNRLVPIETVLETRSMPADAAAVVARAVNQLVRKGEVPVDQRWRALEFLAADYLSGVWKRCAGRPSRRGATDAPCRARA